MRNVLEWLEKSVDENPGKAAFADAESAVTYRELMMSARAAGSFLAQACPPREPVALFLEKTTKAVCALLGAAYAGCCYSFIDLRQPRQRAEKIVETLQARIVLVDASNMEQARELFSECPVELVEIERVLESPIDDALLEKRRQDALASDPLYINFTSGSTGVPKGVVVGHASVIDFIPTFCKALGITSDDVFANQAPLDFDVSVKDLYSTLYLGATTHLVPRDYFSIPTQLLDYLCERKPTVLVWAVSALCFVSIMGGFDYKVPDTVRLVAFSGEVMPIKQLGVWQAALPRARFFNVYGPTEVTCNCTYYEIKRAFSLDESIPIGRAFENELVFLLDEQGRLVDAPEVEGELYVGGPTLALGYYRDPERTAQAFVQNPLHDAYRDVVYKTGDVAKYDASGDLVYLSRTDHQIKHMGQRIELGEIDAAAHAVDGVTRACCIYDATRKRIRMFYTGAIDKKALTSELREALPPFMMPNTVKQLEEMPLTKNGKIDRAKLASGEVR